MIFASYEKFYQLSFQSEIAKTLKVEKHIKKSSIFYLVFGLLISFLLHLVIGLKAVFNDATRTNSYKTVESSIEVESFMDEDAPGNSVTNSTQPASAKSAQNGTHNNRKNNQFPSKTTNNTPIDDFVIAATSLPGKPISSSSKAVKPNEQPLVLFPINPKFENNDSTIDPDQNAAQGTPSASKIVGPQTLNRKIEHFVQTTINKGLFPRPPCKKWLRAHLLNTIDPLKALADLESSQQQNVFPGELDNINRAPYSYFTNPTEQEKNIILPISWSKNSESKIGSLRPRATTPCTGPRELIAEVSFKIDRRGHVIINSAKPIRMPQRDGMAGLLDSIYQASPLEPPNPRFLGEDQTALVLWRLYIEAHCGIDEVLICDPDESF